MAKFVPGTDTTVKATEPRLDVQASATTPLPPGKHVFQLVVTDDAGNDSSAASVMIIVQDLARPTAVIDALRDDGRLNPDPTVTVPFGKAFKLSGERSSDVDGAVKVWTWKLLPS